MKEKKYLLPPNESTSMGSQTSVILIQISRILEWSSFGMILYVAFQIINSHKGLMICFWP